MRSRIIFYRQTDRQTDRQTGIIYSRNITLDVYKGVLIILVVLRHVLQYSVSDEGGILTNFIWAVQMPGFMLVAGYFAARKIKSIHEVKKRVLLSVQHYALPFFSWFILIRVLIIGEFGRNPVVGLTQLITHIDGGLWFLWVVFILSIVATFANCMMTTGNRRVIKTGLILGLFFGTFLAIGKIVGINFLGIKYILYYAVFYGFGWLVKWTETCWKKWWPKVSNVILFLSLLTFLMIVFNIDLYHTDDTIVSIAMRCIAGFTGNAVLLAACEKNTDTLAKARFDLLGMLTLEIYVTHVCVNNLMDMGKEFFTVMGFGNFLCSLILTVVFTTIIIITFKAIPLADFVFYGKKMEKSLR